MHFHNDEKWRFHRWCDSTSHFKGKLTAVSVMARRCPALCERSGGWGQKQLTLLVPLGTVWDGSISQPAIQSVYSWLGTDKHGIMDKWSKLCCPAPWHSKSVNFSLGKLSPTWLTCANSSPNAPPKCLKDAICTWNCGKAVETAQFHELYCSLVHKGWNIQDWILGL